MQLSPDDVELFARVSRDVNPLHVSDAHAQASPYGRVLAHGVLALLALLDELPPPATPTARLDVEFRSPVLPGVEYQGELVAGSRWRAQLRDGSQICLSASWDSPAQEFTASDSLDPDTVLTDTLIPDIAEVRGLDELAVGTRVSGRYQAHRLDELVRRFPTVCTALDRNTLLGLLWSTYLAGMRLPGARCLLAGLSLRPQPAAGSTGVSMSCPDQSLSYTDESLSYTAQVEHRDERFGLLSIGGQLRDRTSPVAAVEIEALVRTAAPPPSASALAALLPRSDRLAGQHAVVVGGSRGLGAALALALAGQGCAVYVGHRGQFPDWLAGEVAGLPGTIISTPGDAGDPAWGQALAQRRPDGLDLLVCSGVPAIRNLEQRAEHLDRIESFVTGSLRLVEAPLSGLLPSLVRSRGRCLVVSSSAVQEPPQPWPHYVTAKAAVEGLIRWAGHQHPEVEFAIARPGLLRTEQTNTPGMAEQAAPVEPVAAALVRQWLGQPRDRSGSGEPRILSRPGAPD